MVIYHLEMYIDVQFQLTDKLKIFDLTSKVFCGHSSLIHYDYIISTNLRNFYVYVFSNIDIFFHVKYI